MWPGCMSQGLHKKARERNESWQVKYARSLKEQTTSTKRPDCLRSGVTNTQAGIQWPQICKSEAGGRMPEAKEKCTVVVLSLEAAEEHARSIMS